MGFNIENGILKKYIEEPGVTEVVIPDGVTCIENYAFYGCKILTRISISNSVTAIDEEAFSGCHSLTGITIPDSVTGFGESVFKDCCHLTIHAPAGSCAEEYAKENRITFSP